MHGLFTDSLAMILQQDRIGSGQHMQYSSVTAFLAENPRALAKGPVSLILAEDQVELDATLRHHLNAGFRSVILFARPEIQVAVDVSPKISRVDADMLADGAMLAAVNPIIAAAPASGCTTVSTPNSCSIRSANIGRLPN